MGAGQGGDQTIAGDDANNAAIAKLLAEIPLTRPKDAAFGHLATPIAFSLAKPLKQPPQAIAGEIANALKDLEIFAKVEAAGGYVNFTLSDLFLDRETNAALKLGANFAKSSTKTSEKTAQNSIGNNVTYEKILLEFVSANPTGPLHIGHARGAFYGDALLRLARHIGYNVTAEYYINDAGNQIELLGRSIYFRARSELLGVKEDFPEECYQGEYILDLAKDALARFGKAAFTNGADLAELSLWAKDKMLEWIKRALKDAGVEFDNFVSERALYDRWNETRAKLEANDALYTDQDGKVWLKTAEKGDAKDRVVVRENGAPTYLAGDIIYHGDKYSRGYDRYINIWGADHHGYIARVKAAVEYLGGDSARLEVLLSQMVALLKGGEPYKMSKRSGNFVTMEEVGQETGYDALRFVFLTKRADTHLEFDIADLKREDSANPVYYVNYAHARICSLFEKRGFALDGFSDFAKIADEGRAELNGLADDAKDLLWAALTIGEAINEAFKARQPQLLTDFLYKLAVKTHKFYADNRVIGNENEAKFAKILALVCMVIRLGLSLLGITAKTRM